MIKFWKRKKTLREAKLVEEELEDFKNFILHKVDFTKENLYFAYC